MSLLRIKEVTNSETVLEWHWCHWKAGKRIVSEQSHTQRSQEVVKISASLLTEQEMNSDHLMILITLSTSHSVVHTYTLIDSKAFANVFIDTAFTQLHHLYLHELEQPCTLNVVDRHLIASKALTHCVILLMKISNHWEDISMFVIMLVHYSVVLSIKWL